MTPAQGPAPGGAGAADRLERAIDVVVPALRAAGRRLFSAEPAAAVYREYLVTMHAIVRASVPLMATALARARALAPHDPVAAMLAAYLPQHIVEETDHDDWLLDDLEGIGVPRAEAVHRPPSPRVAGIVGAQYYWILHAHPVALVGYIVSLERHAPSVEVIDRWVRRTGFDRTAFRTMLEHADLDGGHTAGVLSLVDDLPLDSQRATLLEMSAVHTVLGMAAVIDEVVDTSPADLSEPTRAAPPDGAARAAVGAPYDRAGPVGSSRPAPP